MKLFGKLLSRQFVQNRHLLSQNLRETKKQKKQKDLYHGQEPLKHRQNWQNNREKKKKKREKKRPNEKEEKEKERKKKEKKKKKKSSNIGTNNNYISNTGF